MSKVSLSRRYAFDVLIMTVFFTLMPTGIALCADQNPSWFEHVDMMQAVIIALFGAVIWFCIRTLNKVDNNQTIMFSRLTSLENGFYELRGEHKACPCTRGERG